MRKGSKRVSTVARRSVKVAGFKAARRQEGKDLIERFEEGEISDREAVRMLGEVGYHEKAARHMLATGRAY